MFAPSGHWAFLGTLVVSIGTFAVALRWRSWPLWLLAFGFAVLSLVFAWSAR